jgi:hypothetical protein
MFPLNLSDQPCVQDNQMLSCGTGFCSRTHAGAYICTCTPPWVGPTCGERCTWFYDYFRAAGVVELLTCLWAIAKFRTAWRSKLSRVPLLLLGSTVISSLVRGLQDLIDPVTGSKGIIAPFDVATFVYNVPYLLWNTSNMLIVLCWVRAVELKAQRTFKEFARALLLLGGSYATVSTILLAMYSYLWMKLSSSEPVDDHHAEGRAHLISSFMLAYLSFVVLSVVCLLCIGARYGIRIVRSLYFTGLQEQQQHVRQHVRRPGNDSDTDWALLVHLVAPWWVAPAGEGACRDEAAEKARLGDTSGDYRLGDSSGDYTRDGGRSGWADTSGRTSRDKSWPARTVPPSKFTRMALRIGRLMILEAMLATSVIVTLLLLMHDTATQWQSCTSYITYLLLSVEMACGSALVICTVAVPPSEQAADECDAHSHSHDARSLTACTADMASLPVSNFSTSVASDSSSAASLLGADDSEGEEYGYYWRPQSGASSTYGQ